MRFAFISRMESHPWGGSEELWSRAAKRLKEMGHDVVASAKEWPGNNPRRLKELEDAGATLLYRPSEKPLPLSQRLLRKFLGSRIQKLDWIGELVRRMPDLVLISEGVNSVARDLCQVFVTRNIPFAIVMQAATETRWPTDLEAEKASMSSTMQSAFIL